MQDDPVRHFNLIGASNFRDLGGYAGKDGRRLRWGRLFRSNHLGHLTEADIAVVRRLGVKSAFDFRGTQERASAVCALDEIMVHSLPIEPTVVAALRARLTANAALSPADGLDVMRESYRNYVRQNTARCSAICWRIQARSSFTAPPARIARVLPAHWFCMRSASPTM
jgi:protein-tyrosine phosphatase